MYQVALSSIISNIPFFFQCFKHSTAAIILRLNWDLSYVIVRQAPEKTCSALLLMAGTERILVAIMKAFIK